jgi:hypothetical protein
MRLSNLKAHDVRTNAMLEVQFANWIPPFPISFKHALASVYLFLFLRPFSQRYPVKIMMSQHLPSIIPMSCP